MKRVAIISREQRPSWKSCQVISENLRQAYRQMYQQSDLRFFDISDQCRLFDVFKRAEMLAEFDPDLIIFVEHRPHPVKLLEFYSKLKKRSDFPQVVLHLFGDFPLYAPEWLKLSPILQQFPTRLICASDAQSEFVRKFMTDLSFPIHTCPFPVDSSVFHFSEDLRKSERKRLGFCDEMLFLYTGRISHQKQIVELIHRFSSFLKTSKQAAKLLIAGEFDDLGIPYLDYEPCSNSYYMRFQRHLLKLEPQIAKNIVYLGNLSTSQLQAVYCAADCFVSLSVHNDEDYGMSPAEALCTGLPAILSNWAGYRSFYFCDMPDACGLVPTKIKEDKIETNENIFIKQLWKNALGEHSEKRRLAIGQFYHQRLSISSVASKLEKIVDSDFPLFCGFNHQLQRMQNFKNMGMAPFCDTKNIYSNFYRELYHVYASEE